MDKTVVGIVPMLCVQKFCESLQLLKYLYNNIYIYIYNVLTKICKCKQYERNFQRSLWTTRFGKAKNCSFCFYLSNYI